MNVGLFVEGTRFGVVSNRSPFNQPPKGYPQITTAPHVDALLVSEQAQFGGIVWKARTRDGWDDALNNYPSMSPTEWQVRNLDDQTQGNNGGYASPTIAMGFLRPILDLPPAGLVFKLGGSQPSDSLAF